MKIPTLGELLQRLKTETERNPSLLSTPLCIDNRLVTGAFEDVLRIRTINVTNQVVLETTN